MAVAAEERGGLSDANLIWDDVPTLDGLGPGGQRPLPRTEPDGSKLPEFVEVTSIVPKAVLNSPRF